jgi:hypothetical protein
MKLNTLLLLVAQGVVTDMAAAVAQVAIVLP